MSDDILTTREVAAYLKRSYQRTVLMLGGDIPSSKVGNRWLTRRADVDAYLRKHRTTDKATRKRGRARTPVKTPRRSG